MLSKSKGQILRVAASFHVLFQMGDSAIPEDAASPITEDAASPITVDDGDTISDRAIEAAIGFVNLCCQQTAYMAGRGNINEDLKIIKASMSVYSILKLDIIILWQTLGIADEGEDTRKDINSEVLSYTLKLPGKKLHLTALLYAKKFRKYDNKTGALKAFKELESLELGRLDQVSTKTGPVSQNIAVPLVVKKMCLQFHKLKSCDFSQ